ncbi:hypothetical protein PF010_g4229 [Phytophthora fragariae]|uniref:Secreted protein n=1 Tax=Phytophthora fragariae TaxID=53985 RepID=A0A6G0S8X4_9STRA|nr:hypothetical protein PF010_g4229 [Phytophthora fragariae]KAE9351565.1 hypothetical protein PF008_g5871 [Phytophthora fragariae]
MAGGEDVLLLLLLPHPLKLAGCVCFDEYHVVAYCFLYMCTRVQYSDCCMPTLYCSCSLVSAC